MYKIYFSSPKFDDLEYNLPFIPRMDEKVVFQTDIWRVSAVKYILDKSAYYITIYLVSYYD
jgi:hypothetical protein